MTSDIGSGVRPPVGRGLGFALASALSFGLAGSLGRGLLDAGWSPGAAVTVRVLGGGLALLPWAWLGLRGRWHLLWANRGLLLGYGALGVGATQLCYFYAVGEISAGVALLIEYCAPVVVVAWLWLTDGQRPGRATIAGAGVAILGLILVLDLTGSAVNLPGVLWSLGAMVGAAAYFLLAAAGGSRAERQLPPLVLATGGLLVGGVLLGVAGLVGVLPMRASRDDVTFTVGSLPWWVPVITLCVVTAAMAYAFGITAIRHLGSRLASFVALIEVLATLLIAWWLLDQVPAPVQWLGGALVLVGVVLVKLGETNASLPQQPAHPVPGNGPR